jgi:hypothetical protein
MTRGIRFFLGLLAFCAVAAVMVGAAVASTCAINHLC